MSQASHRMPTISATEALQHATTSDNDTSIRLGIAQIDALLSGLDLQSASPQASHGGLIRGDVTELIGPPGVGKTCLCMQAAVATLCDEGQVVWIDTATQLAARRLAHMLPDDRLEDCLARLTHYSAASLPHLMALLLHPPPGFLAPSTKLLVIDSLSVLIDNVYPRGADDRSSFKNDNNRWLAGRRQATITTIANRLAKLAVMNDLAVLVVNGTVTQIRVDSEAALRPALGGQGWETAIGRRLFLYRDWLMQSTQREGRSSSATPARIAMLLPKTVDTEQSVAPSSVAFCLNGAGMIEVIRIEVATATSLSPETRGNHGSRKRHREDDANSEEDSSQEYGWGDDDELAAKGLVDASFA